MPPVKLRPPSKRSPERRGRQYTHDISKDGYDGPAHGYVEDHAQLGGLLQADSVEGDTQGRADPHGGRHQDSLGVSLQGDQTERRVAARDQNEDGRMVKDPQDLFCPVMGYGVVKRRHGVQSDQRDAVDQADAKG